MKLHAPRFHSGRRGMALISVLAVLFLLTLLVVAFMGRTTGSRATASSYHATANTRLLADMAVNLVQAQINEATTLGISSGMETETWGSQPGAIRVYKTDVIGPSQTGSAPGLLDRIYRLYSAVPGDKNPLYSQALNTLANDLPSTASWSQPQYAAQWVDLNAFAKDSQGRYHFPIVDPRDPLCDPTAIPTDGGLGTLWLPVHGSAALKGFSIVPPSSVSTTTNMAPMPVRWLYILKDGSIVPPDNSPSLPTQLTFSSALGNGGESGTPSVLNPIVGRIAFWTDDESCKININTAAGDDILRQPAPSTITNVNSNHLYVAQSIFWATPMFCANDEAIFAIYQPFNGEIQRYAGHPGTVGLNSTLSALLGLSSAHPLSQSDFYSLTPRYAFGGSESSTIQAPLDGTSGAANAVPVTANRLYTSVGEMIFKVPTTTSASPSVTRPASVMSTSTKGESAAAAAAERANFFLTAHSSSSELNLFGTPRVSIWPQSVLYSTSADKLLAFDATIAQTQAGASEGFYFSRKDPTSSTTDCNLDNAVDGNLHLFDYLDGLTNLPIPGFGKAFTTSKYPNSQTPPATRQIIAEIFDYIRTVNMIDPVLCASSSAGVNKTYGQNWGYPAGSVVLGTTGSGNTTNLRTGNGGMQVVPSANKGQGVDNWGCQGIGSFPIPVEITIDFVALGLGQQPSPTSDPVPEHPIMASQYYDPNVGHDNVYGPPGSPTIGYNGTAGYDYSMDDTYDSYNPANSGKPGYTAPLHPPWNMDYTGGGGRPADNSTAVQAFIYVSFVNPSLAVAHMQPSFCYSLTGLNSMSVISGVNNVWLHFPGNAPNTSAATANEGSTSDEQAVMVDQSEGYGFQNGNIGAWMFGYIPFSGATGNNNGGGSPGFLSPMQTTWAVENSMPVAGSPPYPTGHAFPHYSQIFGLPGQNGVTFVAGNTNPNLNNTFIFNGSGPITLTTYDSHADNNTLISNKVGAYQFTFPAGTLSLPIFSATDSQIIGTSTSTSWTATTPNPTAAEARIPGDRWRAAMTGPPNTYAALYYYHMISPNDTVQSLVLSPVWSDVRTLAMYQDKLTSPFTGHPLYGTVAMAAHDLQADANEAFIGNFNTANWGQLVKNATYPSVNIGASPATGIPPRLGRYYPIVPPKLDGTAGTSSTTGGQGAYTYNGAPGDWDNGIGWYPDGPWVNTADEGALVTKVDPANPNSIAYYNSGNNAQKTGISATFSPNRQMPSPAMFGSLPTGVNNTKPHPWQTLLFRPGPGLSGVAHPGEKNQPSAGDPADYLFLDLFWMPQAEPYPISQPFVTEGKINLNYEIQPFTYITRDNALRAVFAGEEIAVMPDAAAVASTYKINNNNVYCSTGAIITATGTYDPNGNSRLPIDPDQTLGLNSDQTQPHSVSGGAAQSGNSAWYDASAGTTRFFRSASEICEMFLVPQGYNWQEFSGAGGLTAHSWYKIPNGDFALVGDNTREKPYANIYSLLTTKSNTYTVYYTVQALKNSEPQVNAAGTTPGQQMWDETKGSIVGEYRGATTIERYLDPNETYPDILGNPTTPTSLEPYYKWRVLSTRQFAP